MEDEKAKTQDQGRPTLQLERKINDERWARMELANEWLAEVQTIQLCIREEKSRNGGEQGPADNAHPKHADFGISEAHELEVLHDLLGHAEYIPELALELGPEYQLRRDELLMRIARAQDIRHFFLKMSESETSVALQKLGDYILTQARQSGQSADSIASLLDGTQSLDSSPELAAIFNSELSIGN